MAGPVGLRDDPGKLYRALLPEIDERLEARHREGGRAEEDDPLYAVTSSVSSGSTGRRSSRDRRCETYSVPER